MKTSFTDTGSILPSGMQHFDKIGILGGTFNPPHLGHIYMAKMAAADFSLDKVILLPVGSPPHKKDISIADSMHRLNMLEIIKGDDPNLVISDIEIKRQGYTYTVDTLTALSETIKNAVFYYLIGEDTLYELETWKNYKTVFSMTEFICIPRPGKDNRDIKEKLKYFKNKYNKTIALSPHTGPDISSTEIRRLISLGKDTDGLIPEQLRRYIDDNKLYRRQ